MLTQVILYWHPSTASICSTTVEPRVGVSEVGT